MKHRSNYRLVGKNLFLTYSKVDWDKEFVLRELTKIVNIENYIIAKEPHKDGSKHIHVLLRLEKRKDIRSERYFDIDRIHPNIQVVSDKDLEKKIDYCKKEGDFISTFKENDLPITTSLETILKEIAEKDLMTKVSPENSLSYFGFSESDEKETKMYQMINKKDVSFSELKASQLTLFNKEFQKFFNSKMNPSRLKNINPSNQMINTTNQMIKTIPQMINSLSNMNKTDIEESLNSELNNSEELKISEEVIVKNTNQIVNRLVKVVNKKLMTSNQKNFYLSEVNRLTAFSNNNLEVIEELENTLKTFEDDESLELEEFLYILSSFKLIYDRNAEFRISRMNIALTLLFVFQIQPHTIYNLNKEEILKIIETKELIFKDQTFLVRKNGHLLNGLIPYINIYFEKESTLSSASEHLLKVLNRDLYEISQEMNLSFENYITTTCFSIPPRYLLE